MAKKGLSEGAKKRVKAGRLDPILFIENGLRAVYGLVEKARMDFFNIFTLHIAPLKFRLFLNESTLDNIVAWVTDAWRDNKSAFIQ